MTTALNTPQITKLEALLSLLDDDSPMVREAVARELQGFGGDVGHYIYSKHIALSHLEWDILRRILFDTYQQELRENFPKWDHAESDMERLESALGMLARFQNGPQYRPDLTELLDGLSEEYDAFVDTPDHASLAQFLFVEKQIRCMEAADEDADASNLSYVIEQRVGLPISLVCLYMLLGHRHGLAISGCNWPGSFYARFRKGDKLYVVDCGAGGLVFEADELLRLQGPSRDAAEAVLTVDIDVATLVRRTLSNLAFAYRREGETECSLLMLDLLRSLEQSNRHGYHNSAAQ